MLVGGEKTEADGQMTINTFRQHIHPNNKYTQDNKFTWTTNTLGQQIYSDYELSLTTNTIRQQIHS